MGNNFLKSALVLFPLGFSELAYSGINYSKNDLKQYESTHSCLKCDLSNATIYGYESSALDDALMIGSTLQYNFTNSSFAGSLLIQSKNRYILAMVSNFEGARMQYADFSSASLSGSNFKSADLRNVNFQGANLSSSNFSNAQIKNANLDYSILIGSNLSEEQLKQAKSYYCAVLPDGSIAPRKYKDSSCRDNRAN